MKNVEITNYKSIHKLKIGMGRVNVLIGENGCGKSSILEAIAQRSVGNFLIYSPEESALRTFDREGQIGPLGIKGEGLFRLLKVLSLEDNKAQLEKIKENLRIIRWFKDFEIYRNTPGNEMTVRIQDKYLSSELPYFDQKSCNEGFLFLLFYFSLFISEDTPNFFAIDNIEASLSPMLCTLLMKRLVEIVNNSHDQEDEKDRKQVIITTHNASILDGLDLTDDNQRLLVIYRNRRGYTKARRILPPEEAGGEDPAKLSIAFLRGYFGGLTEGL